MSHYKIKTIDAFFSEPDSAAQILIDVRSPSEFAEDHIDGAINMPVLNDDERAMIGTLYKNNSFEARHHGAKLISNNIANMILPEIERMVRRHFENEPAGCGKSDHYHKPNITFTIYCWRGGMRSSSLALVMNLIGYHCAVIDGGYRSYRQLVHEALYDAQSSQTNSAAVASPIDHLKFVALHGPSGSGKTELIQRLGEEGLPVLELEKYANHKGSVLGGDFADQPGQKQFESRLWQHLRSQGLLVKPGESVQPVLVFVEGESRRIGRLTLPDRVYAKMQSADRIWVELPIEERARRLAFEYTDADELLIARLYRLKGRLSNDHLQSISDLIRSGQRQRAAEILLEKHYDSFYRRSSPVSDSRYRAVLYGETTDSLLKEILKADIV